jgi:putative glutamine amidotransferase
VKRKKPAPDPSPERQMSARRPLILISPDYEAKGVEFGDASLSLSRKYAAAVVAAGGLPLVLAHSESREVIAEYVRRADGVLLTGGDDVNPELYAPGLRAAVKRLARTTPDGGLRDLSELLVIDEVFRQRKPLLGVCRGHQLLNVALGGALIVDLPTQKRSLVDHRRMDRKSEVVHSVRLTPGSALAKMTAHQSLGVNSTHHQAVGRVAPALRAVAVSEDGVVEGMEQKPGSQGLPFLLSVQWHPERLQDRYPEHRAIFAAFLAACRANSEKQL